MTPFIGFQQIGNLCFDKKSVETILTTGGDFFSQTKSQCPQCNKHFLKSIFILDAADKNLVSVGDNLIEFAKKTNMQFVICEDCGWWGYPDKNEV